MQEIIMAVVCAISVVGVLAYIFFSKLKVLKAKCGKEKTFLSVDVNCCGEDPKEAYERLRNTKTRATFKGNHKIF